MLKTGYASNWFPDLSLIGRLFINHCGPNFGSSLLSHAQSISTPGSDAMLKIGQARNQTQALHLLTAIHLSFSWQALLPILYEGVDFYSLSPALWLKSPRHFQLTSTPGFAVMLKTGHANNCSLGPSPIGRLLYHWATCPFHDGYTDWFYLKQDNRWSMQRIPQGDKVWLYLWKEHLQGAAKKLKPLRYGPFHIIEQVNENASWLRLPLYMHINLVVNVEYLRLFKPSC